MGLGGREGAGASGSQARRVTGMAGPVDMSVGGRSVSTSIVSNHWLPDLIFGCKSRRQMLYDSTYSLSFSF